MSSVLHPIRTDPSSPTKHSKRVHHEMHHSTDSSRSSDSHITDLLDSAEKWISQQLLFHEHVSAYDLLDQFDVEPKVARILLSRFEKRMSTYEILPLDIVSTTPTSSLQPLEAMLDINQSDHISTSKTNTHAHDEETVVYMSTPTNHSLNIMRHPVSTSSLNLSPSVSPRIYTNPRDYIDYEKSSFDTWFSKEKHRYIIAVQECAASHSIGLPEFIAEMIVLDCILLPGCYTLTGLLFPSARNLNDLFAEYANAENGYISDKTDKGIAYKRKKPMINQRRPENNTASLWMDEDGSICGFRCIWVRGNRGKLMVDQKFCVLNGCWTLTGELTITFETWDMEDEFEGYLEADTFHGRWTTGKELFGEFQWFVTTVESFYLKHNISHEDHIQLDDDGNTLYTAASIGYHDSMASEDELDLEDEPLSPAIRNVQHEMMNILHDKCFDIEINESLTISAKFLKENSMLEISEKTDLEMDLDVANMSTTTDSYDEENEVIGYGKWIRNGKMNFSDVKYMEQKLLLSFDGCCDGKKVLGRLRIYHDNGPHSASPKPKRKRSSLGRHLMENDLDDDDDDLYGISAGVLMDDGLNSEEEEQDDEERISFIQMIIVSNIYDS